MNKKNNMRAWRLIGILSVLIIILAGVRIWNIRYLYTDSMARVGLILSLQTLKNENGWSGNDLYLRAVHCVDTGCTYQFTHQYRSTRLNVPTEKVRTQVTNNVVEIRYE